MRILHSLGSFVNGGVETLLINVANSQVNEGHEVGILIVSVKWSQQLVDALDKRVKVLFLQKPIGSQNPLYLIKLLWMYHNFKADILHLHGPSSTQFFKFKPKNEKRFVTIHNETISIPFSPTVNQYIAISECVKNSFKNQTKHNNCVVCYNGIDTSRFRMKQSYDTHPQKLLFVGRVLFDVKGQDIVIEAISKLPSNIKKTIHLDIWGDGEDMDKMKRMVADLNLGDMVSICGNKDNDYISNHICDYDLMIQASRHEGLGISAIEAMTCGVPVILSSAKGFLEVTENSKYGVIFEHSSVDAFLQAFIKAYEHYSSLVEIAKQAIPYVQEKFSLESYVKQIMNIYNK